MSIIGSVEARLRRRLLISYRLDAEVARGIVPAPLRPELVDGHAVAGVCVLGLDEIRPRWMPSRWGLRSENAAHRVAVEWDEGGVTRRGVYIIERHSSAWHPVLLGGRLFPGVHRRARFTTDEAGDRYAVTMEARGEALAAEVEVEHEAEDGAWSSRLFATIDDASAFYRSARVGWSHRHDGMSLEPVALDSSEWAVEGARLRSLRSTFFDALPAGSAVFDSVVVMRNQPITLSSVPRAIA